MGSFLSKPITDKNSFDGSGHTVMFAWSEMQGWRVKMEDAHIAMTFPSSAAHSSENSNGETTNSLNSSSCTKNDVVDDQGQGETGLFAVFDGHGGSEIARFCSNHFKDELIKTSEYKSGSMEIALRKTFHKIDEMIVEKTYANEIMTYMVESQQKRVKSGGIAAANENGHSTTNGDGIHSSNSHSSASASETAQMLTPLPAETTKSFAASTTASATLNEDEERKKKFGIMETAKLSIQEEVEKRLGEAKEKGSLSPDEAKDVMQLMLELKRLSVDTNSEQQQNQFVTHAGCTAIVALLLQGERKLYVANAGDSRGVLCRGGNAIALSTDHKVTVPSEIARIRAAGGSIENGRVNGSLNLTRSIGDLLHKQTPNVSKEGQAITAEPDVLVMDLTPEDEFIVLACDGIWDVKSNEEVVAFVRDRLKGNVKMSTIIEELLDVCISESPTITKGKGTDNMTCIVVKLKEGMFLNSAVN